MYKNKKSQDYTNTWLEYEQGKDYNRQFDYYNIVDKNERFYAGDQWRGVRSNGLSTPVFNIFKRIINFFIAAILSSPVKLTFVPELIAEDTEDEEEKEVNKFVGLLNGYFELLWEKHKMPEKCRQLLLDGSLSGDMALYSFWDKNYSTGTDMKGDICPEIVDGTNVYFGNPNCRETEKQPYILVAFRQSIKDLREEAIAYGVSKQDSLKIVSDSDYNEQAGDRGKVELDESNQNQNAKTTAILKLWKENGKVFAEKSCSFIVVRPKWDTKLTKYPIAWNNWDFRKNSYHGQAVGTGIIPNQIYINKMFAMIMVFMQQMAFPKIAYDTTKISGITNKIGAAIGIQGDITNAIKTISPPQMSNQVMASIDNAIAYTKEMLGASDAFLGNIKPENTSAIIVTTKQAAVPLESIKQNLYQLIEDVGYQWLDFMANYYGKRKVTIRINGKREVAELDFARLKKIKMRIKIEVGASSYWSEVSSAQVLDNLLMKEKISFIEYLERYPSGMIPRKQELIDNRTNETEETFKYLMLSQFVEANPQVKEELNGLSPEEQEQKLMEIAVQFLGQEQPIQQQEQNINVPEQIPQQGMI